ncbi:MAG: sodium-dependent transporter [Candidatus Omnitrophica bacterium]|nr:sodium-dependent transporter [Candidatus Omnitrophota bacterium]
MTKKTSGPEAPNLLKPKGRERWATRMGVVLAMAANAIGIGNFLRFPVQCAQNGGGAFMIPYFIAFLLIGIPLMWIEWGIGRFGGKYGHGTTPGMFHYLWNHPLAKYVGAIGIFLPFGILIYYNYIVSWTLAYSAFSLTGKYFTVPSHGEMVNFLAAYQGKTQNIYFQDTTTACIFLFITIVLLTWVLSRGVVKGIEALSTWGVPVTFAIGALLVWRVLTLGTPDPAYPERNILNGLGFMWNPNFAALKNSKVWLAATGQIFFTLSVGFGCIQTYASYLSEKDDVVVSGLATVSTNEFSEVLIGGFIAIPVTVAYFGLVETQQIAQNGAFDLGFCAMPLIFQRLAGGQILGTLWFFLLFIAGLLSSIALAQPVMAFLQDEFKLNRKHAAFAVGGLCLFLSVPVVVFLKHGFLDEMDFWLGTLGVVLFAVIEIILFMWVFGARNAWKEIRKGADMKVPRFFFFTMRYVTPVYLIVLLGFWFSQDGIQVLLMKGVAAQHYPYVWFARFLMTALLVALLLLVHMAWQRKHRIQHRIPA